MKRFTIVLLSCLVLMGLLFATSDAHSFRPWLELRHPEVRWIQTSDLARRMEEGDVTLIDVRTSEEYGESHLPGALRAGETPPRGQEVVVYCSLGVRSAEYADRLQAQGVDALNLDGGIFAWANEGRPVEDEDGETDNVHPYNAFFGLFLEIE